MALDMTRRQALGVLGAAAGTLLAGPAAAYAAGDTDTASAGADAGANGKQSKSDGSLYAALPGANSNWGFVDATGAWVIKPAFGAIGGGPGGGNDVVPDTVARHAAQINEILGLRGGVFDGDLFPATTADDTETWGYIDRTGDWAIEPAYTFAGCFVNGYAIVEDNDGYHFITPNGKDAFGTLDCTAVTPFLEGYASLKKDGKWGVIDTKGKWALGSAKDATAPYMYDLPLLFSEGMCKQGGAFIDTSGKQVFAFTKDQLTGNSLLTDGFKDALIDMRSFHEGRTFYGHILYDTTGKELTKLTYDRMEYFVGTYKYERIFNEGLCAAQDPISDAWGYIDKSGDWAIKPMFSEASTFGQGLAKVLDPASSSYGFVDTKGVWRIAPRFSAVTNTSGFNDLSDSFDANGLVYADAPVDDSRYRYGWIDTDGNWVFYWEY